MFWQILLGLGIGYLLFKRFLISRADFKKLVQQGAIIIDVRSPAEFASGHVANSKNIPLGDIQQAIPSLMGKTIIAVCASGMRSGNACAQMRKAGIVCYNAGSWSRLQAKLL